MSRSVLLSAAGAVLQQTRSGADLSRHSLSSESGEIQRHCATPAANRSLSLDPVPWVV